MDKMVLGIAYCHECPFYADSDVDELPALTVQTQGETHHIVTKHLVTIELKRELYTRR